MVCFKLIDDSALSAIVCGRVGKSIAAATLLRYLAMFHRLISQTKVMLQIWSMRPLWAASLIFLFAVVTASGPWACLVHCWLIDAAYHRYHLHYHYASTDTTGMHSDDTSTAQGLHHSSDYVPTALTIAVMFPFIFLLYLLATAFQLPKLAEFLHSITIPPPRRPPRTSTSFVC